MTLRVHPDDIVRESTSPLLAVHESWQRVRLSEVAEILNGFAFKSANFNAVGEGTPLVRIRDVGQPRATTWYSGKVDPRYLIDDGDLLVGMDGDFRSARWQGGASLLNQRVCKITVTRPDAMSSSFLNYVLPGYLEEVGRRTSAITVKHLSSTTLAELPLPLPPRREQERIVAAIEEQFSRLDEASALLRSTLRRAARCRSAVLAALAQSDGVATRLADLAVDMRYGTSVKCSYEGAGVPVLRIPNIQGGRVDLGDLKFAIDPTTDLSSCHVEPGDLLFVRTNGSRDLIGRVAPVEVDKELGFASYLIRLRPHLQRVDPRFVSLVLSAPRYRAEIESRAATTAGQYNLNLKSIGGIEVPVPPIEVQRELAAEADRQLTILDALTAAVDQALARSDNLRRAILSEAFAGRLVAQDPTDEPASVLLERVRAERAAAPKTKTRRA